MKIRGSVAIITGSSRGIGRATALALANEGASVVINCRSSSKEAQKVARAISNPDSKALVAMGDVGSLRDCKRIVARTIEQFGHVDILVNNAGSFNLKPISEMKPEDWEGIFRINVFGAFNMITSVIPHMLREGKGVIVNVSSFVATRSSAEGRVHYASSKAAVIGLTRALSTEVAPSGIRVVGVSPGRVDTTLASESLPNLKERIKAIPLGRLAKPEEIAHTIKYLVENEFITGETVTVSGGE